MMPVAVVLAVLAGLVLLAPGRPSRLAPPWAVEGAAGGLRGVAAQSEAAPTPALVAPAPPPAPAAPPAAFTPAPPGTVPYIPILMYHYVRYVDRAADPLGFSLSVTPEQFAAQLDWLKAAGYETVRMDQAAACMRGAGACPARAVVLTFDDGYMDAYTTALPLLQQRGFVGTFYIVSGFVGQPGYMGWAELGALRDAGMEIGAHTISHPDLTTLGLDELRAQVSQSGAALASALGVPVVSFCYPGGKFNDTVRAVAGESGFTSATTTIQDGPQSDVYTLPRLRISGDLTQQGFEWSVSAKLP